MAYTLEAAALYPEIISTHFQSDNDGGIEQPSDGGGWMPTSAQRTPR